MGLLLPSYCRAACSKKHGVGLYSMHFNKVFILIPWDGMLLRLSSKSLCDGVSSDHRVYWMPGKHRGLEGLVCNFFFVKGPLYKLGWTAMLSVSFE